EVQHVPPGRRCGVKLNTCLIQILWVLFLLIKNILCDALALPNRDKLVFHDAPFEGTFVTVDDERPRIIGISRSAPASVLPYAVQVVILKNRGLRIRDIGLSLFLYIDASRGADAHGPSQLQE